MPTKSKISKTKPLLVVVTGLSGAGLTTAIHALQDAGFFCIDNLPIELMQSAVMSSIGRPGTERGIAFGMDIRDKRFAKDFPKLKKQLIAKGIMPDVVFLTSSNDVLETRYSATRRKHPLLARGITLEQAIRNERKLLGPVLAAADVVIDTSLWSPHNLSRAMEARYAGDLKPRTLFVTITSFGFKHGEHRPLDLLFDVRFSANPHFVKRLKDKTGKSAAVRNFVFSDPKAKKFFKMLEKTLRFLLPAYSSEGKHFLRIGIACTGGQHRSVAFAEELARTLKLRPIPNTSISIVHRDINI